MSGDDDADRRLLLLRKEKTVILVMSGSLTCQNGGIRMLLGCHKSKKNGGKE